MWIVSILGALLEGCLIGVTIGTVMAAIMVWRHVSAIAQEERLRLLEEAERASTMELTAAQTDGNVAATGTGTATPEGTDFDCGDESSTEGVGDEPPADSRPRAPDGAGDSGDGEELPLRVGASGCLGAILHDRESGTGEIRSGAGEDASPAPANE